MDRARSVGESLFPKFGIRPIVADGGIEAGAQRPVDVSDLIRVELDLRIVVKRIVKGLEKERETVLAPAINRDEVRRIVLPKREVQMKSNGLVGFACQTLCAVGIPILQCT